ncbi:MAG: hypothetical protein CM15mP73_0950 [Hyphomicrobiales bacterium]|nr:MAG: hypothetical protein CM15mP73_0950 [Hyphomicrobiales bacterium]
MGNTKTNHEVCITVMSTERGLRKKGSNGRKKGKGFNGACGPSYLEIPRDVLIEFPRETVKLPKKIDTERQ